VPEIVGGLFGGGAPDDTVRSNAGSSVCDFPSDTHTDDAAICAHVGARSGAADLPRLVLNIAHTGLPSTAEDQRVAVGVARGRP